MTTTIMPGLDTSIKMTYKVDGETYEQINNLTSEDLQNPENILRIVEFMKYQLYNSVKTNLSKKIEQNRKEKE